MKENCLSLADRHQHELIIDILKDEIVVAASERTPAPKRVALSPRKIGRPNRAATKPAPLLPSLNNINTAEAASFVGIDCGASGPVIGYVVRSIPATAQALDSIAGREGLFPVTTFSTKSDLLLPCVGVVARKLED